MPFEKNSGSACKDGTWFWHDFRAPRKQNQILIGRMIQILFQNMIIFGENLLKVNKE